MTSLLGHVESPTDKIQFTKVVNTAPGSCAICGSGQDENGFVDTGLDFEFWGRVYFCITCTGQIGAVFGFIPQDDYDDLVGEKDLAVLQLGQAMDRIQNLEKIIDGFNNLSQLHIVSTGTADTLEADPGEIIPTAPDAESKFAPIQPVSEPEQPITGERPETGKSSGKPRLLNI